jgi:hypothetical protein
MSSVRIGGTTLYRVRPWPSPSVTRAFKGWYTDGRGNIRANDRGASQDIYEASIIVADTEDNVNSLLTVLSASRESVVLDQFAAPIFAPNVDHTSSITCAVDAGKRKMVYHSGGAYDVYEVELKLRAISPPLLTPTPSLSGLRVQEQKAASHSWGLARNFFQSGTQAYSESRNDNGLFQPSFVQGITATREALAYFLVTARAASFTLPSFGADYPFGPARGVGPFSVRLEDFRISRENLNRWRIDCDFREVA